MERVGRPVVVGVLVVALLAATGAAYLRLRDDGIALGDRGEVTAEGDEGCRMIRIRHDGLALQGAGNEVPLAWRGHEVEGTLVLERRTGEHGVEGTFTADDGTSSAVSGGVEGKVFFKLGCAIFPPE